jgi:hypothetical protein
MTKDEALKMALETLENLWRRDFDSGKTITAIKAALAQPEQEPVAYMYPADLKRFETSECFADAFSISVGSPTLGTTIPLYTSPPKRQPLTDEQIEEIVDAHTSDDGQGYDIWCDGRGVARAIEAAHGIGEKT